MSAWAAEAGVTFPRFSAASRALAGLAALLATAAPAAPPPPAPREVPRAVFLVVASPEVGRAQHLPSPFTGYRDPRTGAWVPSADAKAITGFFAALPGRRPPAWNGQALMALAYWAAGATPADHWAESEVDSHDLGPGVRAVPGRDTLYYATVRPGAEDDTQELRLVRRVDGTETVIAAWPFTPAGGVGVQALRLEVAGMPPRLRLWHRDGPSGEPGTGGYDPFERNLAAWPWRLAGEHVDDGRDAIRAGRPAVWCSTEAGGEATTHWSWGTD